VQQVCDAEGPYQTELSSPAWEHLFLEAMQQNINWHRDRNAFYRAYIEAQLQGKMIQSLADVPFIHANFFKKHEVHSLGAAESFLHLTSSGTTGQKSQIFFDEWTIKSAQRMVDSIFEYYKFIDSDETNYLLFTYEPEGAANLGTSYTDNFLCKYAPVGKVFYALKYEGQEAIPGQSNTKAKHSFDLFGTLCALEEFALEGKPVRIFGFPAFLNFTLDKMRDLNRPALKLSSKSMTFLGGGWKGHQQKAIGKLELYQKTNELLGIPLERCRDGFGSVEHCIPYIECAHHNFHVPIWSRVLIRHPGTFQVLPYRTLGLLNLISPYITSAPANSVLMGDLATLYPGQDCGCGLEQDFFVIHGRAQAAGAAGKSCALNALEILGRR